jgi:F0F1-type ATP synthase assembly protein I
VKLLPTPRASAIPPPGTDLTKTGKTLGRGVDFALVVLVFLGIGYGMDSWLGTRPWCTIGFVVLGFVGQFIKMYYEYTATMEQLEAERAAARQSQGRRS